MHFDNKNALNIWKDGTMQIFCLFDALPRSQQIFSQVCLGIDDYLDSLPPG